MRASTSILLLAMTATLAATSGAEARGRRIGRALLFVPVGASKAATDRPAAAQPQPLAAAELPRASAPMPPRRESVALAATVASPAPWCPTGVVVGSGAGLCDLTPNAGR